MRSPAARHAVATWRDRLVDEGRRDSRLTDAELLDVVLGDVTPPLRRETVYLDPTTGNALRLQGAYLRAAAALDEGLEVWEAYS